jgi:outer membrane lipoprotein-sorting protein
MWRAAVLIALFSGVFSTRVAQQFSSAGKAIIQRTLEVYLQCSSYRDSGKATTVFYPEGRQPFTEDKPFRTAFLRPGQFRFEFESTLLAGKRYIIWRYGDTVQTWWNAADPPLRTPQSFIAAIGGAMGVSGQSAYRVPSLLLASDISGSWAERLRAMTPIEDGTIDGKSFYRFQSPPRQTPDATSVETVWIDKETFLIRRAFLEGQMEDSRIEVTTDYDAAINVPIPPEQLTFAHP